MQSEVRDDQVGRCRPDLARHGRCATVLSTVDDGRNAANLQERPTDFLLLRELLKLPPTNV